MKQAVGDEDERGLHAVVLHGETGAFMSRQRFDTYLPHAEVRKSAPSWAAFDMKSARAVPLSCSLLFCPCTRFHPPHSAGLAEFLKNMHPGRVVAICVRDEGSFHLKEVGRAALRSLGSIYVR